MFTHDDRLYEAVRRLQIDATVWEVTRRPGSQVELLRALDPVKRYVKDALALASTPELPRETAGRVVPGFCRLALEAACTEVVRRRRLSRGEPHTDVEELLASQSSLVGRLSLAILDDPRRIGEVWERIEHDYKRGTADLVRRCNKGAHEGDEGDLPTLVHETESFAGKLLNLR